MSNSNITRVKARSIFPNVQPEIMYKVLIHDEYVRHCDTNMAEWNILEQIDTSNDISYCKYFDHFNILEYFNIEILSKNSSICKFLNNSNNH